MNLTQQLKQFALGSLLVCVTAGCSPTVQEDRSINFSSDGGGVAFQHGEQGVYVATSEGESPQRIHDASDALAVSSPLWSPVDDRLIFTTAHPAESEDGSPTRPLMEWDADPEGRQYHAQDVNYTCWLREAEGDGEDRKPKRLFTASCDHPGYVAANLAVRWHPDGKRILFVDEVEGGAVSLFEYELGSGNVRRLLELRAASLLFDWSPQNNYLTCSVVGFGTQRGDDGVWVIENPGREDSEWWQVPESGWRLGPHKVATLSVLRETKPAWTDDDQLFSFVGLQPSKTAELARVLYRAEPGTRSVTKLTDLGSPVRDLRWQPDSRRLAYVEVGEAGLGGVLNVIDEAGNAVRTVNEPGVRYFAGWNHDGSKLAYISPEPASAESVDWALVFPLRPGARDRVYVADGETGEGARLVHDGVRITFPKWSPTENELSLWGTFSPSRGSWLSLILPWTLRPGDPAAVLDCDTGTMRWMAVNSHEQSQIGHYYLLKGDYEEAWRWYEKAAKTREPIDQIRLSDFESLVRQRRIYQNPLFFEYVCLRKLGRHAEAQEKLDAFRRAWTLVWDEEDRDTISAQLLRNGSPEEFRRIAELSSQVLQSVFMTQVFFSVDAAEDGVDFFQREAEAAEPDIGRLLSLVCQSQLLLGSGKHADYAQLATYELAPLMNQLSGDGFFLTANDGSSTLEPVRFVEQGLVMYGGGLAVLPMASTKFLSTLSDEDIKPLIPALKTLRTQASSDEARLASELVLWAMVNRLGLGEPDEFLQPIRETNPAEDALTQTPEDVDEMIDQIREFWQIQALWTGMIATTTTSVVPVDPPQ